MTAASLVLLAILILGVPHPRRGRRRKPRAALSHRQLQLAAALATAAGCVLMAGPAVGTAIALVAAPLAAIGVGRLATRSARASPDAALALTLDLAACSLRVGQPVAAALALAAPAAGPALCTRLRQTAGLLRLGADPDEAWQPLSADPVLGPVAHAACRSADSGARLASGWEHLAATLRAELRAAAESRAQRVGVFAMAPLGLCFLPAFVCLGVIPVVIGIARSVAVGGGVGQ